MRAQPTTFTLEQRVFHWLIVFLVLFNLAFPQGMGGAGINLGFTPSPAVHIAIGFTMLALAVIRLAIRLIEGVPPEPMGAPKFFRVLARVGQWGFYALFFAIPLTGALSWYFGTDWAITLHQLVFRPLLLTLIAVHVSLALAHQYIWKTDMLGKITRG